MGSIELQSFQVDMLVDLLMEYSLFLSDKSIFL